MDSVVKLSNVKKTYKLYDNQMDRVKEALSKKVYHKKYNALNGINLEIRKGEAVGIIGINGAGKSTLLKIITGIATQTVGKVEINGRVAAILELGAGFDPEFNGVENIKLNCTLMGMSPEEIENSISNVMEFADLGDYIYQPVKTYSSGMIARLAFAAAINVDPDILIVDEALSVGDMYFQAKSISKMKEIMKSKTVIFVSHTMSAVRSFCNRVVYLKDGVVYMDGDVKEVTQAYETETNGRIADLKKAKSLDELSKKDKTNIDKKLTVSMEDDDFEDRVRPFRSGTGEMHFIRADLLIDGKPSTKIEFGEDCTLRVVAECLSDIPEGATIGYTIRNRSGVDVFGHNIYNSAKLLPAFKVGDIIETTFEFKNILTPDAGYSVSLGLKPELHEASFMDAIYSAIIFEVPQLPNQNWVPGLVYVKNEFDYNIYRKNGEE